MLALYWAELAIGQLLDAFVVHFMDAKQVLNSAENLLAETKAVAVQVQQLLKGLDPVLTAKPATLPPVESEIVENGIPTRQHPQGVMNTLRQRFNLAPKRETAIVPAEPSVPLATKVAAAAPIILARCEQSD